MIERYAPAPFELYCMTDNRTNIRSEVEIVDFPAGNDLELWWNKMYMFRDFVGDTHLFFDLDVVIHNSLEYFFNNKPTLPTFISSRWKDNRTVDINDTHINSSVVMWNDAQYLWDCFDHDPNRYMSIYKGIDRFIWNEALPHTTFPDGHIYSYWKGASSDDNKAELFRKDYSVCIVNHSPKPHEIKSSWIHDYWN